MTGVRPVDAVAFTECRGVVRAFEERLGEGTVVTDDGERFRFHATRIADGTRRIAVGTPVRFVVRPGPAGTWEAADLAPAPAPGG